MWIRLKRCTCLWICCVPDMFTMISVLPSEHSPQPRIEKKLLMFSIMRSPKKNHLRWSLEDLAGFKRAKWDKNRGCAKPPNQQKLFSHILSYGTLPYVAHQMWTWDLEAVRPCRFSNIRKESWTLNCRPFVAKTHDVVFFQLFRFVVTLRASSDFIYIFTVEGLFDVMGGKRKYFVRVRKLKWRTDRSTRPVMFHISILAPLSTGAVLWWSNNSSFLRFALGTHGMIGTSATTVDYSEIPRPKHLGCMKFPKMVA